MPYSDYFKAKFSQKKMIAAVLKGANPNADLDGAVDNGVCETISLLWVINSIRQNGPEAGFQELMKNAVGTGVGAAFWTQVCAAYKGANENSKTIAERGNLRDGELKLLAGGDMAKKISCAFKKSGDTEQIEPALAAGGPYFLMIIHNVHGQGAFTASHMVGVFSSGAKCSVFDPNEGLATEASDKLGGILGAMAATYGTSMVSLYQVTNG
jgi:hypothetical protein